METIMVHGKTVINVLTVVEVAPIAQIVIVTITTTGGKAVLQIG